MSAVDFDERDSLLTLSGLFRIVVAVLLGVPLGLAVTIRSLDLDNRGLQAGIWRSTPRDGSGDIDPYALAANARAGLLPLGTAEGLTLLATTDDAGRALEVRCDYVLKGPMPPTRYWTLSLLDAKGFPVANAAHRYGFTSSEALRLGGEAVAIAISARARSGNWLPVGGVGAYTLMLRLYDTSLSTTGRTSFENVRMPSIQRTACR